MSGSGVFLSSTLQQEEPRSDRDMTELFRLAPGWQPPKSRSVGGKVNKLSSIIDSERSAPAASDPPDVPAGPGFTVSTNSF